MTSNIMRHFLSCDWGTSSFRLRLVDSRDFTIMAEEISGQGILETYNRWQAFENKESVTRESFYIQVIKEHLRRLEERLSGSTDGIPIAVSGMASSTIGIVSLAYQELPFTIDGSGVGTYLIKSNTGFNHEITLITGVKSTDDVMRGEETQLIGLYEKNTPERPQVYIFPGTHSKHIRIEKNQAVAFNTYMTGEFFDLLSNKSILHASVEKNKGVVDNVVPESFRQGVIDAQNTNLLHACFRVRTNHLFERFSLKENYHYLSGLLIGAELQELLNNDSIMIYLCCGSGLKLYYETALQVLAPDRQHHIFSASTVDESVIKGQHRILINQAT